MDYQQLLHTTAKLIEDLMKTTDSVGQHLEKIKELNEQIRKLYFDLFDNETKHDYFVNCFHSNITNIVEWIQSGNLNLDQEEFFTYSVTRLYFIETLLYSIVCIHTIFQLSVQSNVSIENDDDDHNQLLLSTKEEMIVKLAICHLFRMSFLPTFNDLFRDAAPMFPTSRNLIFNTIKSVDSFNFEKIPLFQHEILIFHPLVTVLTHMLCSNWNKDFFPIFNQTILQHCYSILLTVITLYKHFTDWLLPRNLLLTFHLIPNDYSKKSLIVFEQFDQIKNRPESLRYLFREVVIVINREMKTLSSLKIPLSMLYQQSLLLPDGLLMFLESILNSDPTSEHNTTIQKRIWAATVMICMCPSRTSTMEDFCENLPPKVLQQLLLRNVGTERHSPQTLWRCGTTILLYISQNFEEKFRIGFSNQVQRVLDGNDSKLNISIDDLITVFVRMHVERQVFMRISTFFTPMFFIAFKFSETVSEKYTELLQILSNMLIETKCSYVLLDDCLNLKLNQFVNKYKVEIVPIGAKISYQVKMNKESVDTSEINYEKLVEHTMKVLKKMPIRLKFDFFFAVMQHLTNENPPPICLLLMQPLSDELFGSVISKSKEQVREKVLTEDPAIRFLSFTMQRTVDRILTENCLDNPESEFSNNLHTDTFIFCLHILSILLDIISKSVDKETVELKSEILAKIKPCYSSLKLLLSHNRVTELIGSTNHLYAEQICSSMELHYSGDVSSPKSTKIKNSLSLYFTDLSHHLMPVRAHALFGIKQLIYCNEPIIKEKINEIMEKLTKCLYNTDSYIFLAAINALAALSIHHTDLVLPQLFTEVKRSIDSNFENLYFFKIIEILSKLSKSIGDFAYHYSDQFIGCLLAAIQHGNSTVQVSCLSCLGEFCSKNGNGIGKHLTELLTMVEQMIHHESIEFRRAALLFISTMLKGLTGANVSLIRGNLPQLQNILEKSKCTLDEVMDLHRMLIEDELERIINELWDQNKDVGIQVIK